MAISTKQLIIVADTLPKYIRNKYINFTPKLMDNLDGISLIYTTLLPGPELEIAKIAQLKNIPYVVLIPYKNYSLRWPQSMKNKYNYYSKKAIKKIFIDRELGYISEVQKPDIYSKDKISSYFQWISDKILTSKEGTRFLTYTKGLHSSKMREFIPLVMNDTNCRYKKIEIIQSTFMDNYETWTGLTKLS